MMISRMIKIASTASVLALMSSAAYADCNNAPYCNGPVHAYESAPAGQAAPTYGSVTLPGTHIGSTSNYSVTLPGTHMGSTSNYSVTLPGTHIGSTSSFGGVMSDSQADAHYGSGTISGAYVDQSSVGTAYHRSSVSNMTIPGLGANERLYPTDCDVNVHGANGARVIGCYNIAQPVQVVQPVVRVVRPIIYVRRPVIVRPVPVCQPVWHGHYQQPVCR